VKEFRLAAVFLRPGELAPEPLELSYFSPQSGRYEKLEYRFAPTQVVGRASYGTALEPFDPATSSGGSDRQEQDLMPLKHAMDSFAPGGITRSLLFWGWGLPGSLALLLLALSFGSKTLEHLPGLRQRTRQRTAYSRSFSKVKSLGEAGTLAALSSSATEPAGRVEAARQVLALVRDFFEERSLESLGRQTVSEWKSRFAGAGSVTTPEMERFWRLLLDLEGLIYSQGGQDLLADLPLQSLLQQGLAEMEARFGGRGGHKEWLAGQHPKGGRP
jgi:hypothetical protein